MLEEVLNRASPKSLAVVVAVILLVFQIRRWVVTEMRIRALGGHAPRVKTYLPYDLDMLYRAVRYTIANKSLQGWQDLFNEHSRWTVEASPAGLRTIFTADPENIKAILATQFDDYGKGEPFHRDWYDFLGDSIFTTDLDQWHTSRQLLRTQFIKDRVSDLACFERHVQVLIEIIAKNGNGSEIDISNLFFRYTLDAATDFLLGRGVGSLENSKHEFAEAFREVQRIQNLLVNAGPMNKIIPRGSFHASIKVIDDFINPYIEQTLCLSPEELASKTKSEKGYTFLHAIASSTRDRKLLRDQLVAVVFAGRDSTASNLSWTFYELARRPEIVRKLRAEIIDTVGLTRAPTYTDLKKMKYLQNTIQEVLRLYPAIPFNVRLSLKDTTLPHGGGPDGLSPMGVLKDTRVAYSTLIMQRRLDLYPSSPTPDFPHPLTFAPERWQNWQPKPWLYIPFNGGPRICIGQQFALTEIGYTIVRMLQRFEGVDNFMDKIDGGDPCLVTDIVLQPGQGVRVGFWEAGTKVDR